MIPLSPMVVGFAGSRFGPFSVKGPNASLLAPKGGKGRYVAADSYAHFVALLLFVMYVKLYVLLGCAGLLKPTLRRLTQ